MLSQFHAAVDIILFLRRIFCYTHVTHTNSLVTADYEFSIISSAILLVISTESNRPVQLPSYVHFMLRFCTRSQGWFGGENRFYDYFLILAAVAFQFIVSQSLPNVSYLTVLDKYTLSSIFVICVLLLGVVCGLAKLDVSAEVHVRAKYDSYTLLVYVSILTLVQVGFYVYGWMLRKKQMEHFDMGELDLRKLNYKPEKDDPINVVKKGLLPESEKPMASGDASAFISFAGSAHNIIS